VQVADLDGVGLCAQDGGRPEPRGGRGGPGRHEETAAVDRRHCGLLLLDVCYGPQVGTEHFEKLIVEKLSKMMWRSLSD
jgi:hypothetical protein